MPPDSLIWDTSPGLILNLGDSTISGYLEILAGLLHDRRHIV
jgi:hypothetical protein